jgi:hypothetical protein
MSFNFVAESPRLWLQDMNVEDHLHGFHAMQSNPSAMMWSYVLLQCILSSLKWNVSENSEIKG